METMDVDYRLPVTVVTIAGTRTSVDNPILDPRRTTNRMAQIGIEIVPDPDVPQKIQVDPVSWAKRSVTVSLRADGRLSAVNSEYEDQSGARLTGALRIGTTMFGTVAPLAVGLLGPAGGAMLAAAAGLTGGFMAHSDISLRGFAAQAVPARPGQPPAAIERPDPTELGIDWRYVRAHPEQAELLADLRFSRVLLVVRRGKCTYQPAAPDMAALSRELRQVNKALDDLRPGLEEAETQYTSWVREQASTVVDQFYRTFTLDQLPTDEELHQAAANNFWRVGSKREPGWQRLFKNLHVAVSVEILNAAPDQQGANSTAAQDPPAPNRTLTYRRAQLARITQWKIVIGEENKYQLRRELVETKVVVLPGSEQYLPLFLQDGKRTMSVAFDSDGLLGEVSFEHTDSKVTRAEQLRDLPGLLAGAVESGGKIAKGLEGALPTPADPLEELRAELEETELRARLGRARVLVSDPTRSLTLFYDHTDAQAPD
ncbi:hypothetical protein OK351_04110 [Glutamicibacter sp. MNS18]|uniref:hypothetical protein n=1 Tax=Glutamicibacter sp. MNS18 TaxID=2989817 RepID=UPI0022364AFE|nr:hypothetical protein [Glutamicibacter sp. MNS18]MCW4464689.1 hypothetical protein [Glutamicibacter sp. MNS18]